MAKPRKKIVDTKWSSKLAYVIGIIATDGNLSPDGRHINVTSKDLEMVLNCKSCLNIYNKIGKKCRGYSKEKKYFVLQFGDTNFYEFLLKIGLTPKKSKTISQLAIPDKYFADFFRGCIDGDGSITITSHPESKNPQYTIRLVSASKDFLVWILRNCKNIFKIEGGSICKYSNSVIYTLRICKKDSLRILRNIYRKDSVCLTRKRKVAELMLKGKWRNWNTRMA